MMQYSQWDFMRNNLLQSGGNGDWKTIDEDLGDFSFTTFVKLQPAANPGKREKHFRLPIKRREMVIVMLISIAKSCRYSFVTADGNNASLRMVQIFMLVVVLLLVIASINYVNLSTARSLDQGERSKYS